MVKQFRGIPTDQLTRGDVVHSHGMILLVDRQPVEVRPGVWTTKAQILNIEEVRQARHVPMQSIRDGRWTIQGNDLATWIVEVA